VVELVEGDGGRRAESGAGLTEADGGDGRIGVGGGGGDVAVVYCEQSRERKKKGKEVKLAFCHLDRTGGELRTSGTLVTSVSTLLSSRTPLNNLPSPASRCLTRRERTRRRRRTERQIPQARIQRWCNPSTCRS
jgi:hypothetical protein